MSYCFSRHDGYTLHAGVKVEDGKMHPHREDESNVKLAEMLGYTVDRSTQQQRGITFEKGRIRIWQTLVGGKIGWQVADIYDDHYRNHRPVGSLTYALLREAYRA